MPPVDPRVPDGSGDGRARSDHERFRELEAGVAQPAGHLPCKQEAAGSTPAASSRGRAGLAASDALIARGACTAREEEGNERMRRMGWTDRRGSRAAKGSRL